MDQLAGSWQPCIGMPLAIVLAYCKVRSYLTRPKLVWLIQACLRARAEPYYHTLSVAPEQARWFFRSVGPKLRSFGPGPL